MTKLYAGAALVALAAGLGAGIYFSSVSTNDRFASCRTATVSGGSIGGPFTLLDGDGSTVTDADIISGPTLVYFGYTFCPDVCPLDTVRNADAAESLAEDGYDVTPVFISVDPKRDTPEVVADYAANIDDRMIGLTGSPEQIQAVADAYKVYYRSHDDGTDDYYLVDHSTFTYLMLPDHGFVEFFRRELHPADMAERIACFLDAA